MDLAGLIIDNVPHEKITVARGEMLFRTGDIIRHIYVVIDGALRVYYQGDEDENVIRFGYSGSLITGLDSFLSGNSTAYGLEAIRKSNLLRIKKADYDRFVAENEVMRANYSKLLEQLVLQQMEREVDLLITSPQERLRRVVERSPQLFQEVPAKYIAAYLRMTPETMSRTLAQLKS